MASRLGQRLFAQATKQNVRVAGRSVVPRRPMSSGPHTTSPGNDNAWRIGSAVVFGPALLYLLSPFSRPNADAAEHHAHEKLAEAKSPSPVKDDEGTEAPAADVAAAVEDASNTDSPKDAQAAEEQQSSQESHAITDDEGTTASSDEVKASVKQAVDEDSPADAQKAAHADATYGDGAPGQTSDSEGHDQKEKPSAKYASSAEAHAPGEASQEATSNEASKEAAEESA